MNIPLEQAVLKNVNQLIFDFYLSCTTRPRFAAFICNVTEQSIGSIFNGWVVCLATLFNQLDQRPDYVRRFTVLFTCKQFKIGEFFSNK